MKKILLIGLMCVMGCVFSGSAFAASFPHDTKVTRVAPHDSGDVVLIFFESNVVSSEGCNGTSWAVALKTSHPLFVETYQVAMTALLTQKNVWGYMYGGCYRNDVAHLGQPYIIRLDIKR